MVRNSGNAYGIHDEKQPNQFRADEMKEESDGRDGLFSHFMMQAITCLSSSSSLSFWTGRSGALGFKEWVLGIRYITMIGSHFGGIVVMNPMTMNPILISYRLEDRFKDAVATLTFMIVFHWLFRSRLSAELAYFWNDLTN